MIRPILLLPLAGLALLAGCATPRPRPSAPAAERPANLHEQGLERVMGQDGRALAALFGPADLDTHEGQAERLQFVGPACVLDAYLYPAKPGGPAVVSYIDARRPDGTDIDRASCVAALARR